MSVGGPRRASASRSGCPSHTTTRSSAVSSSLRRPAGVMSRRSASSRTEMLPSPAEIRPRDPSRRPAREDGVGGGARAGIHARPSYAPADPADGRSAPRPGGGPLSYHRRDVPTTRSRYRFAGTATSRSCCRARRVSALGDARQLHGPAPARARPDRLGFRDGHRRAPSRRCPTCSSGWSRAPSRTGAIASG